MKDATNDPRIKLIEFCEKYYNLIGAESSELRIDDSKHTILITTFWLRILENYEGIIALIQRGTPSNGFILIRSMAEAYILMKKCVRKREFMHTYFNKAYQVKIERLYKMNKLPTDSKFKMPKEEVKESVDFFKTQINNDEKNGYSIWDLATDVDEIDLYCAVYSHCSIFVHSEAASMECFLTETDGLLGLTTNKFILKDSVLTSLMASQILFASSKVFFEFRKTQIKCEKKFIEEFNILAEEFNYISDQSAPDVN